MSDRLTARWISLKSAHEYVTRWHRHLERDTGAIVALAAYRPADALEPCGVIVIGRPKNRFQQAALAAEVTRCAVPEHEPHVCSFLYARARRVAQALGFRRLITSTLASESGVSLRAAGAELIEERKARTWDRPKRGRSDRSKAQTGEDKRTWSLWEHSA